MTQKLVNTKLEILGTTNPLAITIPRVQSIVKIDLDTFYHRPSGAGAPEFLSIIIDGIGRKYNEKGRTVSSIATLPLINGFYQYTDTDMDNDEEYTNGNQLFIRFANALDTNSQNYVFDNNYLLNLSILSVK